MLVTVSWAKDGLRAFFALFCVFVSANSFAQSSSAPVVLNSDLPSKNVYRLLDGTIQLLYRADGNDVVSISSTDSGQTWSEPNFEFTFPEAPGNIPLTLVDRDGELQAFLLVRRGEGGRPSITLFYDIWHARTRNERREWSAPKRIFEGYVGSLNGVTQLDSGRLVLPHQIWVPGRASAPPTGSHIVTTSYSDDGGATWRLSPAALTAPCDPDYIGNNYGACEPTLVPLKEGRAWMLMRTQTGFLYESYSTDGVKWTDARPSPFYASSSPASLLRLEDGRIVIFWNNCEEPSRVDGRAIYCNRDALHAAISDDEGMTWLGYREVRRDPHRNESPPMKGDRGTAYPFATQAPNGRILLTSGQGQGRIAMLSIEPDWIAATQHEDDFSHGLDGWSTFKPFGPVLSGRYWRDRINGPRLVRHPADSSAQVLHVCRPDDKPGDEAVWNFPAGARGSVTVRLLLREGFHGAEIALTDRFIQPGDPKARRMCAVRIAVDAQGTLPTGQSLAFDRWYSVKMLWDIEREKCIVQVDNTPGMPLAIDTSGSRRSPVPSGFSYLRLRSPAIQHDTAGFLVERVQAHVER